MGGFEIGRHFFFDFGPPHDFYELFIVRSSGEKMAVERITLTPTGIDSCIAPTRVDTETAILDKDIAAFLGKTNPCAIPEKELRRELKRCKKCSVFSGANVMMQFVCGAQTRLIRANVLDRDMFDPAPQTPEHTSWTMHLLEQLEAPLGPGVIYRPIFPIPEEQESPRTSALDPDIARELGAGKYDALFAGAPDKPSQLYEQALSAPPLPTVELVGGSPIAPDLFLKPKYSPLARLAHLEGTVTVKIKVGDTGVVSDATVDSGPPLLGAAAVAAAWGWRFPKGESGRETLVTIKFASNCPQQNK
jgi:TonB family protein